MWKGSKCQVVSVKTLMKPWSRDQRDHRPERASDKEDRQPWRKKWLQSAEEQTQIPLSMCSVSWRLCLPASLLCFLQDNGTETAFNVAHPNLILGLFLLPKSVRVRATVPLNTTTWKRWSWVISTGAVSVRKWLWLEGSRDLFLPTAAFPCSAMNRLSHAVAFNGTLYKNLPLIPAVFSGCIFSFYQHLNPGSVM